MCWPFGRRGWQCRCTACVWRRRAPAGVWLSTLPPRLHAALCGCSWGGARPAHRRLPAGPARVPAPRRLSPPALPGRWGAERAIPQPLRRAHALGPASGASRSGGPGQRRRRVWWWSVRLGCARGPLWPWPPWCPGGGRMDADERGSEQGGGLVRLASQMGAPPLPAAACSPSAGAAVQRRPIATALGQSAPRQARPVAGQPCRHTQAGGFGRAPNRRGSTRKPMPALLPWLVLHSIASHHVYAPPAAYKQGLIICGCCAADIWSGRSLTTRPRLKQQRSLAQ
jgi:hypothetical protein